MLISYLFMLNLLNFIMSDIVKYEILNPTSSNKEPYYDDKKELFIFPTNENIIVFKDGNNKNYSISNLKITKKLRINKENSASKYRARVEHNSKIKLERRMWRSAKERANRYGLEFSILPDDIFIPEICPVLGIRLEARSGKLGSCSPSLDKIDPQRGYSKDNIQVISHKANTMKSNATKEELLSFAQWIFNEYS